MNDRLRDQLIRHEGLRLKPYRDTVGKLTIGVGRNLDDVGISRAEAEVLLDNDVAARVDALGRFPWYAALDEVRQAAILDMSFMGIARVLQFRKMIAALEADDWPSAAAELLDSKYARQVGARAEHLAQQIRSGEWQT